MALAEALYPHRQAAKLNASARRAGHQNIAAAELLGVLADFPTPDERAAIASGWAAYENGDFVTVDQWRHEMGLDTH
jgi:hypothetical protein